MAWSVLELYAKELIDDRYSGPILSGNTVDEENENTKEEDYDETETAFENDKETVDALRL